MKTEIEIWPSTYGGYIKDGVDYAFIKVIKVYTDDGEFVGQYSVDYSKESDMEDWSAPTEARRRIVMEKLQQMENDKKDKNNEDKSKEEIAEDIANSADVDKTETESDKKPKLDNNQRRPEEQDSDKITNSIDVVVYLDSKYQKRFNIAMPNLDEDNKYGIEKIMPSIDFDPKAYYGIFTPLLSINRKVIMPDQILAVEISTEGFLPTVKVILDNASDTEYRIEKGTYASELVVELVCNDKTVPYKNIVLNCQITSNEKIMDTTHITGSLYPHDLYEEHIEQIHYTHGLESVLVIDATEEKQPTIWQTLYEIAYNSGWGFASTEDCLNIHDNLSRNITHKSYVDYINEIMSMSGTDNTEMLDCWIDFQGYIILVNVYGLLNNEINPDDMYIYATQGFPGQSLNLPQGQLMKIPRLITNYQGFEVMPPNNMLYDWSTDIVNTEALAESESTIQEVLSIKPEGSDVNLTTGNGEETAPNSISQVDICKRDRVLEDTENTDGQTINPYKIREVVIKTEFGQYPTQRQKQLRNAYFKGIQSRHLLVKMKEVNFGLCRGMLVTVYDETSGDPESTIKIKQYIEQKNQESYDNFDEFDETTQIPNPTTTDIYYIDAVKIVYDPYNKLGTYDEEANDITGRENPNYELKQYLYLIKRTKHTDLYGDKINSEADVPMLVKKMTEQANQTGNSDVQDNSDKNRVLVI